MITQEVNTYFHVGAATTAQVATVPALLHTININQKAAAACLITVYDNTSASGNIIAVIDGQTIASYVLDVVCQIGIYVSASSAPGDVTVSFARPQSGLI